MTTTITDELLRTYIERLHLQDGDILVIDPEFIDIKQLTQLRIPTTTCIPIVVAPAGSICRCTRRELLTVLAALPEEPTDA